MCMLEYTSKFRPHNSLTLLKTLMNSRVFRMKISEINSHYKPLVFNILWRAPRFRWYVAMEMRNIKRGGHICELNTPFSQQ